MDMTDMTRAAVSRRHFLQLAGAGMLALTGTALAGCGNSTSSEGSDKGSKLAAIKSRGHLNAGVKKDVPGYGYYDTAKGRFEGMEVDLCYQIAAAVFGVSYKEARAQELVEFADVTPKTRGPLIDNGQLDVVAATYTITDERKKAVSFAGPYFVAGQDLLVRKDDNSINGPEDLNGKRLCSVTGSTSAATVKKKFASEVQLMEQPGYAECATALFSGIVDAVTTDDIILAGLASASRGKLRVVGKPFTQEYYGVGIKKGDTALAKKINAAIAEMIKDGSWERAIADNTEGTSYTPNAEYNPPKPTEGEK